MLKKFYNYYFPTPSFLSMNCFGIDISDQSIKYGELLATDEGLHLGSFGKELLAPNVVLSGKIINQAKLVEVLKKIKEKEGMTFVRVSLPEEQMYLFTLMIPFEKKEDIKNSILIQLEEHIPLKAIDTIFEYDIISETNKEILVQVTAVSVSITEEYTKAFMLAGLTPLSFELEAQATARAVMPVDYDEPVMIVDFGDTKTGVTIVYKNKIFFTTTLDIGGVNLTNMIAKNFSLSFEKAEEMKRSYGLDGSSNIDDIFPVILNGISVLRDELNKQEVFWQNYDKNKIKNNKINEIILCGGDSNLTGLADYLKASMKIKVRHANTWINISTMDKSVPNMSFEQSLSYTTVLGLALGSYSYNKNPIMNMLDEDTKLYLNRNYWKRFIVIFLNLTTAIVIIFILLLLPSYFFSISKEKIVEARLEQLNKEKIHKGEINLEEHIANINKNLILLSSQKNNYSMHDEVIGSILSNKPKNITFSQIIVNRNKDKNITLEIRGESKDRASLKEFKANIDKNKNIKSSELPISSYLEKNNLNFNISIIMK